MLVQRGAAGTVEGTAARRLAMPPHPVWSVFLMPWSYTQETRTAPMAGPDTTDARATTAPDSPPVIHTATVRERANPSSRGAYACTRLEEAALPTSQPVRCTARRRA